VAITLDVITKVVDSSLRDSSSTVEKHFSRAGEQAGTGFSKTFSKAINNSADMQKAFDKAADSAGKLRVEQQKLEELQSKGVGGARLIAQQERLAKVTRETQRAVRETADTFQHADRAAGSMLSTLSNITAGTRIGGLTSQATSLASSLSGVGLAAGVAIGGFTAIAVGAVAAASKLYDMGKMWDDVADNITAKTGKVGSDLQAITDQVAAVGTTTAATQEELGNIAAQSVQSLRLSGDQLGAMMKQLAELNNLTGEQTNVRGLGMIFRMFKVDAQDQIPFLNDLYSTFQQVGIPVNDLIATLDKGGTVLSGFGMSATQAAATIALFEQAGVPADQALRGLTTAFKNLNDAGKDPTQGLRDMVYQIRALHDAGNDLGAGGARDLAEQYFGKGFGPILQSIIDGRLEIDKLPTSVGAVRNSIDDATTATEDFTEHWQKFKNQFASDLKPAADAFFSWMNSEMDKAITIVDKFKGAWDEWANTDWWSNSGLGKILSELGLAPDHDYKFGGSFGDPNSAPAAGTQAGGAAAGSTRTGSNQGLTPNSVNAKGAIESAFPGVNSIGGWRPPDITANGTFTEHSSGQAIDVMVPNWNTPQGKSYGEQIKAYALANASSLGVDYVLWQQTQWNADGSSSAMSDRGSPTQNHMDHVHIHTAKGSTSSAAAGGQAPGSNAHGAPGAGSSSAAAPTPVGPGVAPSSPSTADFPSSDAVGPATATTTPVQMVPSPFGPQYAPVPAGSTPGYNNSGKAGTFLPDPGQVKSSTKRYEGALDNINKANEAIAEAKARQVEIENDLTADSKQRADAAKNVAEAEKRRDALIDDAKDAQDALAQAKLGTFREAQKAQQAKSGALGDVGASLADDFGISGGLAGVAKWFTTYLANMAFAPMIGQLSAVSAANPIQGGSGLIGMAGARNLAATGSVLGTAGPVVGPGTATSDSIPAMLSNGEYVLPADTVNAMGGPGGVASTVNGYAEGGPVTDMQSVPQSTQGGPGFQGLPGINGLMTLAAPALDAMAPGAGQAAKIGVQLANRTAAYAGQLAGIGVSGLLETFLPHGSPIADPGNSWLGKLASGFAGAKPALPNKAGDQSAPAGQPAPAQTPEQAAALNQQTTQPNAPMVQIDNMHNNTPDGGRTIADQLAWMTMTAHGAGGPR